MKTNSITVSSSRSRGHIVLSWALLARVYNAIPLGICHCDTADDAKQYTKLIVVVLTVFIMAGIYDAILMLEGEIPV